MKHCLTILSIIFIGNFALSEGTPGLDLQPEGTGQGTICKVGKGTGQGTICRGPNIMSSSNSEPSGIAIDSEVFKNCLIEHTPSDPLVDLDDISDVWNACKGFSEAK